MFDDLNRAGMTFPLSNPGDSTTPPTFNGQYPLLKISYVAGGFYVHPSPPSDFPARCTAEPHQRRCVCRGWGLASGNMKCSPERMDTSVFTAVGAVAGAVSALRGSRRSSSNRPFLKKPKLLQKQKRIFEETSIDASASKKASTTT